MLTMYPACFFPESDGGFTVVFPDLNYLSTQGKDLNEAMSMAIDCLAGYLYEDLRLGISIPSPSSINNIDLAAISKELGDDNSKAWVNLVSVDVEAYAKEHFEKAVKKTLTIPAWLNRAAIAADINFSQALQEILITKLKTL